MNKLLQKLAFRAGCKARKFTRGVAIYQNVHEDLQRYGELIIKECVRVLRENDSATPADTLLSHFGVKDESTS